MAKTLWSYGHSVCSRVNKVTLSFFSEVHFKPLESDKFNKLSANGGTNGRIIWFGGIETSNQSK